MFVKNDSKTPPYLMGFRRALYKGAGFTGEALDKPLIGVVNSWGEISPATKHMNKLAKMVKGGIESAGGTPVEFVMSGLCDGTCAGASVANTYNMAWRDIATAYIEAVAHANQFDGLVFLSVCDEVVPAHLMAAARLNLPSIIVCGGTMYPGRHRGGEIWAGSVTEAYAAREAGEMDQWEYEAVEDKSCTGAGACGVMGTGNTMQAFAEAVGLTLPGNSIIPGVDPGLERQAYESGKRVVQLVKENICPLDILTPNSLENGIRVVMAIGGSTNITFHALAWAYEAGLALKLDAFDRLSRETPFICDVQPSGKYPVHHLHWAGGIPAVMKEISSLLNLNQITVSGQKLKEIIENTVPDNRIIRKIHHPLRPEGGIAVLRGNLAPQGAVIKTSAAAVDKHRGPAKVFETEEAACKAIISGDVKPGDVLIIRGMGPKGGPGLPCLYASLWLLKSRKLDDTVALITDGRLSGTIRGIAVAHVAPESYEGGPLALVRRGDMVTIDIPERKLTLEIRSEELEERQKAWEMPRMRKIKGFMSIYVQNVQTTDRGAYLSVD